MARPIILIATLFLVALAAGCSEQATEQVQQETKKPVVYVSNYPLHYFVERIAADLVELQFPVAGDGDPAFWQPTAEEVASMQRADIILLNGATYEQWLPNVTLPSTKLVDTSRGFGDQLIASEETVTHSHGPEGEHEHEGTAFTTWLDLTLAVAQAEATLEALTGLLPEESAVLEDRFRLLKEDLLELDADFERVTLTAPDTSVVFSHPVYQYLQRRYKVKGTSVHWEPGIAPDSAMWKEYRHTLEHHPTSWMIWEGEPLPDVAEELRKLGVESVVFNPCGNRPDSGDFLSVMRENLGSLKRVFE